MSFWSLLSSGTGANMTAGFKPCPWLIPEDMPRRRFQPLAGRIYFVELGGLEPPAGPGPAPDQQHQASPANTIGQRIEGFAVLNQLAFVFLQHRCRICNIAWF